MTAERETLLKIAHLAYNLARSNLRWADEDTIYQQASELYELAGEYLWPDQPRPTLEPLGPIDVASRPAFDALPMPAAPEPVTVPAEREDGP